MRRCGLVGLLLLASELAAHDAHGHSHAPLESRRLKNPVLNPADHWEAAKALYRRACASCHGDDGRARTHLAGTLPVRPTDLSEYMMDTMRDGEIYWVVTHGISAGTVQHMPPFDKALTETERWEVTLWVRELRRRQKAVEVAALGPYEWSLPPGFPYPKVPADNPMTAAKVELGRYLFYDKRLSLNGTQSCASCHKQEKAFSDGRARGLGSTGELHPRGPMSLTNVAYSPVLTWANPNLRKLEQQALAPLFGETPVELGYSGKEDFLLARLRAESFYRSLAADASRGAAAPISVANVTKAIASFERILLSGDSPYDAYRRGENPNAISASAKRGEALFFSEQLECFHCHGGFNFTGSVDYFGKAFAEVEFHNTGLYNLKGRFSYPEPNLGLYEFTQNEDDVGKFKAPTLRNIAVTAPYMHDGSVATLDDAIAHYKAGGRTIQNGPLAGYGSKNPAKSEFVRAFDLSRRDTEDLVAFLKSLTDRTFLTDRRFSNPFEELTQTLSQSVFVLHGEIAAVYPDDGVAALYHREVPGFLAAMEKPASMEFQIPDKGALAKLRPGMKIVAGVRRRGNDYVLEQIRPEGGFAKKR
jgi:cytochrome c peroxidase